MSFIIGFGASCIAGFGGIAPEKTFFSLFVRTLSIKKTEVISLGGYPVTRVKKYALRLSKKKPDIVILQFGSTDVGLDLKNTIRKRIFHKNPKISLSEWRKTDNPVIATANIFDVLKWYDRL